MCKSFQTISIYAIEILKPHLLNPSERGRAAVEVEQIKKRLLGQSKHAWFPLNLNGLVSPEKPWLDVSIPKRSQVVLDDVRATCCDGRDDRDSLGDEAVPSKCSLEAHIRRIDKAIGDSFKRGIPLSIGVRKDVFPASQFDQPACCDPTTELGLNSTWIGFSHIDHLWFDQRYVSKTLQKGLPSHSARIALSLFFCHNPKESARAGLSRERCASLRSRCLREFNSTTLAPARLRDMRGGKQRVPWRAVPFLEHVLEVSHCCYGCAKRPDSTV